MELYFNPEEKGMDKHHSLSIEIRQRAITTPKNQYSNRAIEIPPSFLNELLLLRNSDEDQFVFGGTYPLADSTVTRRHKMWIKKSGVKKWRRQVLPNRL